MEKLSILTVVHKPYESKGGGGGGGSCQKCGDGHCGKCGGGKCA